MLGLIKRIDKSYHIPLLATLPYIHAILSIFVFTRGDLDLTISIVTETGVARVWLAGVTNFFPVLIFVAIGVSIYVVITRDGYSKSAVWFAPLYVLALLVLPVFVLPIVPVLIWARRRDLRRRSTGSKKEKTSKKSRPDFGAAVLMVGLAITLFQFPNSSDVQLTYGDEKYVGQILYQNNNELALYSEDNGREIRFLNIDYDDKQYCVFPTSLISITLIDAFSVENIEAILDPNKDNPTPLGVKCSE